MSTPLPNFPRVMLSVQQALLGEVFPALREVVVEWTETAVHFVAYVDGPLAEEDSESLSIVCTEMIAEFWPIAVTYEVVVASPGEEIMDYRFRAFQRRK